MNADREFLYQHVEFLTTLRPFRNHKNLESLERVCDHLKGEFRKYGLEPTEQKFPVNGLVYKNILASYNMEKPRRLIVGAHYDVCGDQSLCIHSVSFTNNKRHGLGFCFDQLVVLDDCVPDNVPVQKFMSQLMGQDSKPHGCIEPFLDDHMTTQ